MKKTVLFSAMLCFGVASFGGVTATESPPGTASDEVYSAKTTTCTGLAVDHSSYELAVVTTDHATNTFTVAETAYSMCPYDYGPAKESAIVRDTRGRVEFDLLYVDVDFGYRPDIAGELQTTTMVNYWDMTQWTTRSSRLV